MRPGLKQKNLKAAFFCYVKAPIGTEEGKIFKSAAEFSDFLIQGIFDFNSSIKDDGRQLCAFLSDL